MANRELDKMQHAPVDIVEAIPVGLFIYQFEPPNRLLLLDGNHIAEQLTHIQLNQWRGYEFDEIWATSQNFCPKQTYLDVLETGRSFETEQLTYSGKSISEALKICVFPMPAHRVGVTFENIAEQKQTELALQDNIKELKITYQQAIIYAQELTGEITERRRADQELRKLNEELEQRVSDRTRDLSVLYLITMVASDFLNLDTMLTRSLDQVLVTIKRNIGAVHLVDENQNTLSLATQYGIPDHVIDKIKTISLDNPLVAWIIKNKEALLIPNVKEDKQIQEITGHVSIPYTFLSLPMRARGRVLGILTILGNEAQQFNAEEVALLASVADQVGVAVENARLRQQAEHTAVIEERERLARELHDSVTQSLYSLTLFAKAGENLIDGGQLEDARHNLKRMGETAQQALKEMRLLVYQLRPLDLDKEGLIGALHQRLSAVEGRVNIKARLVADDLVNLPPALEEGLYRIAQEALNNALKHAAATTVTIYLRTTGNEIELEVVDDGTGLDPVTAPNSGGMGLQSMQERAKKLGGTFSISSTPNKGTSIKVRVNSGPIH
jgi:signal transduction histidine kinase